MPHSSLAIANEFLTRAWDARCALTHMQVQKLTYLAHGWSLGAGRGALVEEQFEAWTFGPVVRKLYDSLKHYGPGHITKVIRWGDDTPLNDEREFDAAYVQTSDFERDLLDFVYRTYGEFHAYQLSALTHLDGTPWQKTYVPGQNKPISNDDIEAYFERLSQQGAVAA
jgi:uncharacterized phage-associated protein